MKGAFFFMGQSCVQLKGICKSFGKVQANQNINFDVRSGEIHALLGENGSGKSTLMNILSGVYSPDSGTIEINGEQVVFSSPKDSIKAGVGMVYQHFKLTEVMTARENIVAGEKGFIVSNSKIDEKIKSLEEKYALGVDPNKKIYDMSVGEKQNVEILKVLYRGANILILDEPTAVLTPQEIRVLFGILKNMRDHGCAIVIITHKLYEVLEISDRVTILRKGESIETIDTASTNAGELTEKMVGAPISLDIKRAEVPEYSVKPILKVKDLCVKNSDGRYALDNVSLTLNSGEILGIAGIAGSGQKELCEAIAGLQRISSGEIEFKGESLTKLTPRDIIKRGITMSFVPEDRLGMGLAAGMNVIDNILLKSYNSGKGIFVDRDSGRKTALDIIGRLSIATPSPYHVVKKLSGGNIQKILLGREINLNPSLLITAYPVRGLDIGASYNIYDILNNQKQKGVGILFIGEDLDVMLGLCDKIAVLYGGKISAILDARNETKEHIGMLMLGRNEEKEEK